MSGSLSYFRRLIAVVGDERTDEVLIPWARTLAADLHLPLLLLQVTDAADAPAAVSALAIMDSDTRLSRVRHDVRHELGHLRDVLPAVAEEAPGTLVLLAQPADAEAAATLPEWPSYSMLSALKTPFVLIPPGAVAPAHIHSVVVGNDRSRLAEEVLNVARVMGHSLGVDVIEVQAIEPADIAPGMPPAEPVVQARLVRANGRASRVILRTARARDAALIVIGSHGVGRGSGPVGGATTAWLLANADRPIVVVPRNERPAR